MNGLGNMNVPPRYELRMMNGELYISGQMVLDRSPDLSTTRLLQAGVLKAGIPTLTDY